MAAASAFCSAASRILSQLCAVCKCSTAGVSLPGAALSSRPAAVASSQPSATARHARAPHTTASRTPPL